MKNSLKRNLISAILALSLVTLIGLPPVSASGTDSSWQITLDACHSGSAINYMSDGPCPRILYTACLPTETSDGSFHLNFCNASGLSWDAYTDADGTYGDNNGFVSVREAFLYADAHVPEDALESDPDSIGEETYFG